MKQLLSTWSFHFLDAVVRLLFGRIGRFVRLRRLGFIEKGHQLNKEEKFKISSVEPVLLSLTAEELKRSDSDLARELQEKLNAGLA